MARYDEDLHENPFFQTLVGKYAVLFKAAAEQKRLICVPRSDTVARLKLSKTDFENHILQPVEGGGESNAFLSANNKQAVVEGDLIRVEQGYKEPRSVKILFEECFFNSRDESYQVFCLEQPLEGALSDEIIVLLENLEDCIKFLWSEPGSEKVRRSVDRLLEIYQLERDALRPMMDTASAVYTRAVQEVFKLKKFQAATQRSFLKLAIETYVMAGLHKKIFKEVCFLVAQKDATLNKITRNLSDTHPQYLGIKPQFRLVIPRAKAVLSQLNQFATPLEKINCFKHSILALTAKPLEGGYDVVTADELLPILVYLVIVCDIPNWNGNLTYITRFHFSNIGMEEFAYYLASYEAAVEYVRNEAHQVVSEVSPFSSMMAQRMRSNSEETSPVKLFFKSVTEGDFDSVRALLEEAELQSEASKKLLCHPLCTCDKCTALQDTQLDDSDRATVYSRDENGRTGLHYAALMGHNELVSLLLDNGAIVAATDHNSSTPLHLACQKGHQKCTLLLLGEGSSVNATDIRGNTPLHLTCSNGHEECVKALLFHKKECAVNATNEQGDTPLHNAARWGFAAIVQVLLQHDANTNVPNKRREIPQQCAQSRKVQELLSSARRKSFKIEDDTDTTGSPPTLRKIAAKHRRTSLYRDASMTETDRQLKKLFRAIQDDDINYVKYLFGWDEAGGTKQDVVGDLCHPLCQCDRCSKIRKTPVGGLLVVNSCDLQGHTPLHQAALQGQLMMVELLLKHGALIDTKTRENMHTPLHLACQYNHKDVVSVLLKHRASINPCDVLGNTPLHFTCNNGHMEIASLLLSNGADIAISNVRGDTPLHSAARWNHPRIVNELVLYGAQFLITNNEGKTPLDLTKDDDIQMLITKAMTGQIPVGYMSAQRNNTSPQATATGLQTRQPSSSRVAAVKTPSPPPPDLSFPRPRATATVQEALLADTMAAGGPSSKLAASQGREASLAGSSRPRLDALLRSIESYDRNSSLRHSVATIDRSAPVISAPPTPVSLSVEEDVVSDGL